MPTLNRPAIVNDRYFPRGPQDTHERAALAGDTLPEGYRGGCLAACEGRYLCTLGIGHEGDHVAADEETIYARWQS